MKTAMKWLFIGSTLAIAPGIDAATLWSNGAVNTSISIDLRCDTGPNTCGATGGANWTIFDNFSIAAASNPWVVSGFDFTDFFVNGSNADITGTTWEIFNGDPLSGGKLVASGSATASETLASGSGACGASATCREVFTVTLSTPVTLSAGATYYLGTSNTLTPTSQGESLFRAFAAGGNTAPGGTGTSLGKWEQSNGTTSGVIGSGWTAGSTNNTFPFNSITENATAFDIFGTLQERTPVPEPGSLILAGLALGSMCLLRRRNRTRRLE